ncbi:ABC transporter ATP-binding protein [Rhodospirillum sp. A1_3_36]|uniref:ABC transporter ATP-binding protein n=1 Tax=Rhodospirillum sp. A1_3_36 TaxID=3391666 RepID=UPI0039A65E88
MALLLLAPQSPFGFTVDIAIASLIGIENNEMARLKVDGAWIEFPVQSTRHTQKRAAPTGGQIDSKRGIVTALRDISFDLREGDRLGLVGHNGAGKSTMLRLLAGVYSPTRGRVLIDGSVSTLFNSTPGLSLDGTGRENIITCGLYLGLTRRQIATKIEEIVDFAELGEYIDLPVRIYSSGMVTRLGFSIATAVEPEILLLDEGLATGDAQFAQKAQAKMLDMMTRSSILVIASHSESLVANMCSRCIILEHGRILAEGSAANLVESYRKSVVESAQTDDPDGLYRAYVLATDMARHGELPPPELEEQGLRYALQVSPDDGSMWQRYVQLLNAQGKPVSPEVEVRTLLSSFSGRSSLDELQMRLSDVLSRCVEEDLSPEVRQRVRNTMEKTGS